VLLLRLSIGLNRVELGRNIHIAEHHPSASDVTQDNVELIPTVQAEDTYMGRPIRPARIILVHGVLDHQIQRVRESNHTQPYQYTQQTSCQHTAMVMEETLAADRM
jgi:hypothetical protein